jgi:hypothetical protein
MLSAHASSFNGERRSVTSSPLQSPAAGGGDGFKSQIGETESTRRLNIFSFFNAPSEQARWLENRAQNHHPARVHLAKRSHFQVSFKARLRVFSPFPL